MSDAPDSPVVDPATPVIDPAAPASEPNKDWKAEADKWKSLARKHEDSAKANLAKAKQFDEVTESQKSEQQKLADKAAAAEAKAMALEAKLAISQSAVKHGLTGEDLELLGTHGTPEEIDARAERLAKRLKAAAGPADFGGGSRGADVGSKVKQLSKDDVSKLYSERKYAEIEQARSEGRLANVLGSK